MPRPKHSDSSKQAGVKDDTKDSKNAEVDESVCQVPDCQVLLSSLKVYNQRCRVCQEHLVAPIVDFRGTARRFCQQCARFHDLTEFDGNKRSCRVRLERHKIQRRKRKSQAAEMADTDLGGVRAGPVSRAPHGYAPGASTYDLAWESMVQKDAKLVRPLARVGGPSGDEEGESYCPPGFQRRNMAGGPQQLRPGFLETANQRLMNPQAGMKSPMGASMMEPANLGWGEDLHSAPGGVSSSGVASQRKDNSFMDAVLMKLHDDDPVPHPSALEGAWPSGKQQDFAGAQFFSGQDVAGHGSLASNSSRFPSAFQDSQDSRLGFSNTEPYFEAVGDLGYRNIQECIDGLPFSEINGPSLSETLASGSHIMQGFDSLQSPSALLRSHLDTGRIDQHSHGFGRSIAGNGEQFSKLSSSPGGNNGALMNSILRVLHDSHEDDSSSTSMYNTLEMGAGSMQWPSSLHSASAAQRLSGVEALAARQAPHMQSWFPGHFG